MLIVESKYLTKGSKMQVALWLSGRVLDSRSRDAGLSLISNAALRPCLILVQPRKTCSDIIEKLLTGI